MTDLGSIDTCPSCKSTDLGWYGATCERTDDDHTDVVHCDDCGWEKTNYSITLHHVNQIVITLFTMADGTYVVAWNDGVANGWYETYSGLALALVRFAVLVQIDTEAYGQDAVGFAQHDEVAFTAHAAPFLRSTILD